MPHWLLLLLWMFDGHATVPGPEGVSAEVIAFHHNEMVFVLHNGGTHTIGAFECEVRYYDAFGVLVPIEGEHTVLDHDASSFVGLKGGRVDSPLGQILEPGETDIETLPANYGPIPERAVRAEMTLTRVCAIAGTLSSLTRTTCWPPRSRD